MICNFSCPIRSIKFYTIRATCKRCFALYHWLWTNIIWKKFGDNRSPPFHYATFQSVFNQKYNLDQTKKTIGLRDLKIGNYNCLIGFHVLPNLNPRNNPIVPPTSDRRSSVVYTASSTFLTINLTLTFFA